MDPRLGELAALPGLAAVGCGFHASRTAQGRPYNKARFFQAGAQIGPSATDDRGPLPVGGGDVSWRTERLFSPSRTRDLCWSIHSICSASRSQPFATSSKPLFMGPVLCLRRASFGVGCFLSVHIHS
jgi:hypothetical protein